MKPSATSHLLRSMVKALGADVDISPLGLMDTEVPMPSTSMDPDSFKEAWFIYNLLRKREVERPETEEAARSSFARSEERCAAIEERGLLHTASFSVCSSLLRARQIAYDLLGDKPPKSWLQECTFTGGASTSRKRSDAHPALKWWARPSLDVTPLALVHLQELFDSCPTLQAAWGDPGILACTTYDERTWKPAFNLVPGSRLRFVEKNYKTKRTILIEPDGNMLLQKGIGNVIRKILRKVGINLNDQTRSQRLAFAGSLSGTLGTVDLSAASDSVTLALLSFLLPPAWYDVIYAIRSHLYQDGDVWKRMVKVSSMGNGFTFELESFVFYCLTQAVVDTQNPSEKRLCIYGDDIIVASEVCGHLEEVMETVGFSFNREKSFWTGSFRESCGKHYHSGLDVTPVYAKADVDCLSEKFRLYNQVRDWAGGLYFDPRYSKLLDVILQTIPEKDRRQTPVEYGPNAGLHYGDVCTRKIRVYMNRNGITTMSFSRFTPSIEDYTSKLQPEVAWLYRHMERWQPSCPLGISVYTSLALVREGELGWAAVSIPCSHVGPLMP